MGPTLPPFRPFAYCAGRLDVMRFRHNLRGVNLELLRTFLSVVEHGSLNKAAERMRVSQSTLTRQMQSLEQEMGGRLLERSKTGVALTAAGYALHERVGPLLVSFDEALRETRTIARGKSATLRLGYTMSAADYLHPALTALRRSQPQVKVRLFDLSPGEQIEGLRKGELDLALIGNPGTFLSREFFVRRLVSLPVYVALAESHPLAAAPSVRLAELRGEQFVGVSEKDIPGHNQWLAQACRRAGFRPRGVVDSDSLTHGLATIVSDGAVALLPEYTKKTNVPGVVFRPLRDATVRWDLALAWQRGKLSVPVKAMLDALPMQPPK
jgi:DNA-binding transcriptional LysR family regulator